MSFKSQVARVALLAAAAAAALGGASPAAAAIQDVTPPSVPASGSGDWPICGPERSSVTLKWKASVDEPEGSGLKGYFVDYDGREIFVAADAGETLLVTGIAPGSGRSVFVRAVDNAGNRSEPRQIYRAIASCVPEVPGNLRVVAITPTSVTLSWTAPVDPDRPIDRYNVYSGSTRVMTTSGTTVTVTGLQEDTTYSFTVEAIDDVGLAGAKSAALTVLTPHNDARDVTPPSVPTEGSTDWPACGSTPTSAVVTWGASVDEPGGSGLKGYTVARGVGGPLTFVAADAGETLTLTGLGPEGPGTLYVSAVDNAGNASSALPIFQVVASCGVPTRPAGLRVTEAGRTWITLSWNAATSPDSTVKGYRVYLNGVLVRTVTGTSTMVTGLLSGTDYTFAVSAIDARDLESEKSDRLTYRTPLVDPPLTDRYGYTLAGTASLKTLTKGNLPLKGGIVAEVDRGSGAFTADLTLNQTSGRLVSLGFLPVTAKIGFVTSGKTTGTLKDGKLTSNSKVRIKVQEVKLFGAIPLAGGNACQAKQLSDINLASVGNFSPTAGGTIAGTFKISDLNGCGVLNGLVSPLTAGDGNTISLNLTPAP